VIQNRENEVGDHEDQRTDGDIDGEQTDHAENREIDTGCCLLQRAGIHQPFGVNVGVVNEQKVVSVSKVNQVEADGGEAKDQGGDAWICDG